MVAILGGIVSRAAGSDMDAITDSEKTDDKPDDEVDRTLSFPPALQNTDYASFGQGRSRLNSGQESL